MLDMTPRSKRIGDLLAWVIERGLLGEPYDTFLEALCHRLSDVGIPLQRMNLSMRAYHPYFGAFAYRWKRDLGMTHEQYVRDTTVVTGWDQSPLKVLVEGPDNELRYKIAPELRPLPFPMFEELLEQGVTEYFAQTLAYSEDGTLPENLSENTVNMGLMVSWSAYGEGGFSDDDIDDLRALLPVLGLALKSKANYRTTRDLLKTYLGRDASRRVISGEIDRGSSEEIKAVILMFDLSGFTRLSEELDGSDLVEMLNAYYSIVVTEIHRHGGNVLKFMGDGLLAVFRDSDEHQAGQKSLDAVQAIAKDMEEVNVEFEADGRPFTGCTMALHSGCVHYGNIGSQSRLDFTVIGPAVNATSRILGMCGPLDQQIVISDTVARPHLETRPELVSLGQYRLRGVSERMELFTLD